MTERADAFNFNHHARPGAHKGLNEGSKNVVCDIFRHMVNAPFSKDSANVTAQLNVE
jgi:hypothetical protein